MACLKPLYTNGFDDFEKVASRCNVDRAVMRGLDAGAMRLMLQPARPGSQFFERGEV